MDKQSSLQINVLGKPQIWLDGKQLTRFSTAKTEALLYFLASTRQAHSRETLAGLLWSEMPETTARRNLTKSLTVLRRLLGPFLRIEAQRVGFDPELHFDLDEAVFRAACASDDLEPEAIALYRGDFLAGFFAKGAVLFEEWLLIQREQLRNLAIDMLERLIERAVAKRAFADGAAYSRRLLELDPWRETAHRRLMLMQARQGQHAAALAQYALCKQLLADELGVDPMPETEAVYRRIKAARNARLVSLPQAATLFIGRNRELAFIERLLQDPACRLVTITGLGGAGKTRLASAAAQRAIQGSTQLFLNGVAFVSLVGVDRTTAVAPAVANALNVPLSNAITPHRALLNFLHNRELLIVLDNLEHLLSAADLISEILEYCPDVKLLVTSREPLNLATEWRLNIDGLPVPPDKRLGIEALQGYESVELFVRAAAKVNTSFELSEANSAAVAELCRLVAGVPLALQLAATWLRAMPVSSIVTALKRDLDLLAAELRDLPPRQRSMRAVFESTWQLLTAQEQQAVEMLSVCHGGFTEDAASAIAGTTPFLLRSVIDRALVDQQGEARYGMHVLMQQFAGEKLSASGHEETAALRHGRYYLSWIAGQEPHLYGQSPQTAIQAIKQELDNLNKAWEWAARTRQADLMLNSFSALKSFFDLAGLLQDGEALIDRTISEWGTPVNETETLLLCRSLIAKGRFGFARGKYETANTGLEEALTLAQRLDHAESIADVQEIRGGILTDQGAYFEARQHYLQALALYRDLGLTRKTARILCELGWNYVVDDILDDALTVLDEAIALERTAGHKRGEVLAMANLSVVYGIRGDPEAALANQRAVLASYEELGDLLNLARTANNMGMTLLSAGRYTAAVQSMLRAVELLRELGALPSLTNALDSLGTAYIACGQYDRARSCLDEALSKALEIGYTYLICSTRHLLARFFNHTGDLVQAAEQLDELKRLLERLENDLYVARALSEAAYLAHVRGALQQAVDRAAQALAILRQNPATLDTAYVLLQQGGYLREQQRQSEALPLAQEALEIAHALQHEPLQLRANAQAALFSQDMGDNTAAEAHYRAAVDLLARAEPFPDILQAVLDLSRYCLETGSAAVIGPACFFVAHHPAGPFVIRQQAALLLEEATAVATTIQPPDEHLEWSTIIQHLVSAAS